MHLPERAQSLDKAIRISTTRRLEWLLRVLGEEK
jgi:hypothetical protein